MSFGIGIPTKPYVCVRPTDRLGPLDRCILSKFQRLNIRQCRSSTFEIQTWRLETQALTTSAKAPQCGDFETVGVNWRSSNMVKYSQSCS
jgi:hypothetical protein